MHGATDTVAVVEPDRWVAAPARDSATAAVRLFTFAHAGGGGAFFRPWRGALGPHVDVRPVLLPGRESRVREPAYRRMEQLLDPLCAALEPHLDRPYALFGHSAGAVVAYEVARRLSGGGRRPGRPERPGPVLLLVSGRRAPRLPTGRRRFCTLPDDEFLAEVGRLNGTPPEVLHQADLIRLLLPALRADFELNEMYQPLPGLGLRCPLAAYMGLDDPEVDPPELLGWRAESSGEFTLRVFDGDHFYLRGGRPDVLAAVRADLERALARRDRGDLS